MNAVVLANYSYGSQLSYPLTDHKADCKSLFWIIFIRILHFQWKFLYIILPFNDLFCSIQSMRKPKLFWVSAATPLTSVILSTILVVLFKSKLHGIQTVRVIFFTKEFHNFPFGFECLMEWIFYLFPQIGHLPKGLNPPSSNMLYFNGPFLAVAIKTGIVTGILSLTVSRKSIKSNAIFELFTIHYYMFLYLLIGLKIIGILYWFFNCLKKTQAIKKSAKNL